MKKIEKSQFPKKSGRMQENTLRRYKMNIKKIVNCRNSLKKAGECKLKDE